MDAQSLRTPPYGEAKLLLSLRFLVAKRIFVLLVFPLRGLTQGKKQKKRKKIRFATKNNKERVASFYYSGGDSSGNMGTLDSGR